MASTSNFDLAYNKQDVVAGGALSNATPVTTTGGTTGTVTQLNQGTGITLTPSPITGIGTIANAGVTKIISSGSNVTLSPTSGVGDVTISVTATSSGVSSITGTSGITPSTLTTGAVTLGLAAITPTSVNGITLSGSSTPTLSVTGTSSISGTNTGDQTNITGTAGNITATSNSTLTTLSALSLPGSQVSGNISGNAANVTGTVAVGHGGTGTATTPTDGQLLIGKTSTSGYSLATLTGAGTVSITNGPGTITITGSGGGGTGNVTGTGTSVIGNFAAFNNISSTAINDTGYSPSSFVSATATQTAHKFLASPTGSTGVPTFRAIDATDVPTLNQNTTGTAANVTGIVAVANGGTGTATPSLVNGTGISITGSFPNQTITNITPALPSGGSTSKSLLYGTSSAGWYLEHYNVKAFGAVGDGSTDDHVAINSAISAINSAGGGVLYFPKGTYKITTALTIITVPCKVCGDGKDLTTINSTYNGNCLELNTAYSVMVCDLTVTNTNSPSSGYGIYLLGPYVASPNETPMDQPYVSNVAVFNYTRGLLVYNTVNGTIIGCNFQGNTYGVYIDADISHPSGGGYGDAGSGFITNCVFTSNSSAGLYQTCNGGLNVVGNQFHSNYYNYRYVGKDTQQNSDLVFVGNWMDVWSTACMSFEGPATSGNLTNVVITGNTFSDLNYNYYAANVIQVLTGPTYWFHQFNITGNAFQFAERVSATAISLTHASIGNISGNTFFGVGGTGLSETAISIDSTCSYIQYDPYQTYYIGNGTAAITDNQSFPYGSGSSAYSISSGSSITLAPVNTYTTITGTSTISTINGGWQGRTISLYIPSGLSFTTGGNIAVGLTASAGQVVQAFFDGTYWYLK